MGNMFDLDLHKYLREKTITLADRVKFFREDLGMTQTQFANQCNLARSTIQDLESGTHQNVQLSVVLTAGWALEKTPGELFGGQSNHRIVTPEEFELINAHRRIFGRLT